MFGKVEYFKNYHNKKYSNETSENILKWNNLMKLKKISDKVIYIWILKYGSMCLFDYMIKNYEINAFDNNNYAIKITCLYGNTEIVDYLLNNTNNLIDPFIDSNYPIRIAAQKGYYKIVELLLNYIKPIFDNGEIIKSFNNKYVVIDNTFKSIGSRIIDEKHCKILFLNNNMYDFINLTYKAVKSNSKNNYALRYASKNGHINVVRLLLEQKNIDPSDDNNFAIKNAFRNNHHKIVLLLLKDKRIFFQNKVHFKLLNKYIDIESKIDKKIIYDNDYYIKNKYYIEQFKKLFYNI